MFDTAQRAKPILKWAGGKSGPLSQLVRLFPASFKRYLEPFMGGGAVFFSLQPGHPALLGDCNPELIELYEVVREKPDAWMAELDRLQALYSEDFFYELRSRTPKSPVKRAARTLFLNKTGFNGLYRMNTKGEFNVPFGKRPQCPALYERRNVLAVSERLKHAVLREGDFEAILSEAGPGDFVYCDPPYEPLSRTSTFTSYLAGGFSQEEQRRLEAAARAAAERGAFVALSNSTAPFILDLFSQWQLHRIGAKRAINSKGSARGVIEETVATLGYLPQKDSQSSSTKVGSPASL